MKFFIVPLLFIVNICFGQGWEAEVGAGGSGYNGDLTEKLTSLKIIRPAVNLNVKYNFDNTILLRGGIAWLNVAGDDKYNNQPNLKQRNLNLKVLFGKQAYVQKLI